MSGFGAPPDDSTPPAAPSWGSSVGFGPGVGPGGAGGRGQGRGHARSASHVGILRSSSDALMMKDQGQLASLSSSSVHPPAKGHQRALSQGQNEARGHRREGSKTDFILPEGHEQRERQREMRSTKVSIKRSSLQRKGHSRQASRTESVYTIRDQKRSLINRLFFWRKNKNESCSRRVVPNHAVPDDVTGHAHPNYGYYGNQICTTKYTLLSFLPKNLFEQFHRFANLYFLFIVLLNFVPSVNAFAKELALMPLVFVLGVTAVKDAYEDHRRYLSDGRVNGRTCRVYSSLQNRYVKVPWRSVRVGDVVHLSCEEMIPADVVLLNSSDEHGLCYVESSNLDGETNLKQRQCVRGIGMDDGFEVSKLDNVLEVGPPTTKIYHFVGSMFVGARDTVPLTKDNLILRDCVVKNTDFVEGIVVYAGRDTKALLNNGGTRYKRSRLEREMNREVVWCVVILVLMALFSCTGSALWQNGYLDAFSLGLIPFLPPSALMETLRVTIVDKGPIWIAFTNFWTFIILYQVLIPISLYVTIEIIKLMQIYHIHHDPNFADERKGTNINCRALNISEELGQVQYVFTDKTGTLTENEMVFQRCSVNGVDYAHSPILADAQQGDSRDSFVLNPQLQEEVSSVALQTLYSPRGSAPPPDAQRVLDFFFTLAACNTVIVAKRARKDQMNASGVIVPSADPSPSPHPDGKGGTTHPLRARTPLFRSLFPSSSAPPPRSLSPIASSPSPTPPHTPTSSPSPRLHFPLSRLAPFSNKDSITPLAFETLPESEAEAGGTTPPSPPSRPNTLSLPPPSTRLPLPHSATPSPSLPLDAQKPFYEAESPDELALVDAAYKYGVRLLRRNLHSAVVALPGSGVTEFEVLNVLPFDSDRKRMSIIVKDPRTGEKVLYCKGADSAILSNLCPSHDSSTQLRLLRTKQQLEAYSQKGLRVLCMAKRVLAEAEYDQWSLAHKEAMNALANRDRKLAQSFNRIEVNMQLTGATGIEDRLQEGVPETVKALRDAGIVVWVLTGDKQETAINIAYSCSLFTTDMEILKLNGCTKEQTERMLCVFLQQVEDAEEARRRRAQEGASLSRTWRRKERQRGLVVDGRTLVYILDRRANLRSAFLLLAGQCHAVMCCRATPLQKALIVGIAKDDLKVLTLAVGDGANDVSMIQTADVGVGISGVEGRQAVMASDFAVTRFHHLQRLLLVHGHWCYDRLSKIILYFFYKNASFVFLLMWFQLYCGFSTSVMMDDLYLVMFNLLFTSLPPITVGIYDKDAPESVLLTQPHLYAKTRLGTGYTPRSFWVNIADALYQSVVIFFVGSAAYNHTDGGFYEFGMTLMHSCLITQLLHIAIETKSWTVIHVAGLLVSYSVYFAFGFVYTVVCNGCLGLPSQYGELMHMVLTPKHWFCVGVSVVLALLPRFVVRSLQATLLPDEVTQAVRERKAVNEGQFVDRFSRASSVSSVFRPKFQDSSRSGEEPNDVTSSLVTMTTILSANEKEETEA